METLSQVSRPTYTVYLPAAARASGTAIVIIPGGAYEELTWSLEGTRTAEALQDRGIAAVLLKQGEHGFFQLTQDEWRATLWAWLASNGWLKP
jgi:hypothetical protein